MNLTYQNETVDKLISKVCGTVVGGEYDFHLALWITQLCVECNAVFSGQVTILLKK